MKNIVLRLMYLCGALFLMGGRPIGPGDVHLTYNEKYFSCDYKFYQKGWDNEGPVYNSEYESIAKAAFIYALMSSNSYEGNPQFITPSWTKLERITTWRGLVADVYKSAADDNKLVIVFRGTDSVLDYFFGNFNFWWKGQYEEAEKIIDNLMKTNASLQLITTGHSLGGGLALHASLYKGNIESYVFNTSPRVFNSEKYSKIQDKKILISEKGEILEWLRRLYPALKGIDIEGTYDKFNFLQDSAIKEHNMYYIARGLTAVSASVNSKEAQEVIDSYPDCHRKTNY